MFKFLFHYLNFNYFQFIFLFSTIAIISINALFIIFYLRLIWILNIAGSKMLIGDRINFYLFYLQLAVLYKSNKWLLRWQGIWNYVLNISNMLYRNFLILHGLGIGFIFLLELPKKSIILSGFHYFCLIPCTINY